MIKKIIDAKVSKPLTKAKLLAYQPKSEVNYNTYTGSMDTFIGTYRHPFLGQMEIKKVQGYYYLFNNIGRFRLFVIARDQFYPEDLRVPVRMVSAPSEDKRGMIETFFNPDRSLKEVVCYY